MPFVNKLVDGDIKAVAGGRRIASRLFFCHILRKANHYLLSVGLGEATALFSALGLNYEDEVPFILKVSLVTRLSMSV